MGLNFTIMVEFYGVTTDVPLCENGETMTVTQENKLKYVALYVDYLLKKSVKEQLEAFRRLVII